MASYGFPPIADRSLGEAINVATRSVHAKLNKLILLRLPFAIPPNSRTPSTYITALLHITPIYMAFESLWKDILLASDSDDSSEETGGHDSPATWPAAWPFGDDTESASPGLPLTHDMRTILQEMLIPGLLRAARLRADILALTGWPDALVDEQLQAAARSGWLGEFIAHIRRSVKKNPHVLLAYSWVLYMALFSGGRFIRASLESLGNSFWKLAPEPVRPSMLGCHLGKQKKDHLVADNEPGSLLYSDESHLRSAYLGSDPLLLGKHHRPHQLPLAFFHFATARDGEDLKSEFKGRLLEAEKLLTSPQRDDVVRESTCIFENMILVVAQLDAVCGTPADVVEERAGAREAYASPKLGTRLRDSLAVARERMHSMLGRMRLSAVESSGDDEDEGPESDERADSRDSSDDSLATASHEDNHPVSQESVIEKHTTIFREVHFAEGTGASDHRHVHFKGGTIDPVQPGQTEAVTQQRLSAIFFTALFNFVLVALLAIYFGYLYLQQSTAISEKLPFSQVH